MYRRSANEDEISPVCFDLDDVPHFLNACSSAEEKQMNEYPG